MMTAGTRRLDDLSGRTTDLADRLEQLDARLSEGVVNDLANAIVQTLLPTIRGYLLANYRASGVKTNTGKLQAALGQVGARFTGRHGRPAITIYMPPSVGPYKHGAFYAAAAAVNYGAVRAGMTSRQKVDLPTGRREGGVRASKIGSRAKQTVKRVALGYEVSGRAVDAVERGREARTGGEIIAGYHIGAKTKETAGSVKMHGGAVVIKPKTFWPLTPAQSARVVAEFESRLAAKLEEYVSLVV